MIAEFTQRVLVLLRQEFPTRGFRIGDEMGVITDGSAQFGMSNLMAQHEQSSMSDDEFDAAILENFASALKLIDGIDNAIPRTWDEARSRLRVQLVSSDLVNLGKAVAFPFADDVHVSLVSDCDTGYAYIGKEDLERWGQSALDAIEIGKQNVLDSHPDLPMSLMSGATPMIVIQTGDGYDAARVLIPEIRSQIIRQLSNESDDCSGAVYVGVPNRDFLIAWPTHTDPNLHDEICATVAKDARCRSHPLSESVLRVSEDRIELMARC